MPKVDIPFVPRSSEKLDAEEFNRALYSPTLRIADSKSLEAINGHIDHQNLNEPAEDYADYRRKESQIPKQMIRRGALARSKTSSDLGPSHFNRELWRGHKINQKFIAIPGCGVSLFVPNKGVAMLTWQISIGHDGRPINYVAAGGGTTFDITREDNWTNHVWEGMESGGGSAEWSESYSSVERCVLVLLKRTGTGKPQTVPNHRFELPPGRGISTSFGADPAFGRTWSGHKLLRFTSESQFGWHHYAIGVSSQAVNTMIRVRNIKYCWFNGG